MTVQRSEWNGQIDVPKGGRLRRVPMTKRLARALSAHRHLRGPRVLYRDDGQPFNKNVAKKAMARVQRRAAIAPTGGIHILRHTFCSHLAMRGAPARAIQELAGHRNLRTTERYMHLSPAAVDQAIHLLDRHSEAQPADRAIGDDAETTAASS